MRAHTARAVEVLGQEIGDRSFTLWLRQDGRPGARGLVDDPFATWAEVIERLRYLEAYGAKHARVRIVSLSLRLTSAERRQISALERAGMRLTFEAIEFAGGRRP